MQVVCGDMGNISQVANLSGGRTVKIETYTLYGGTSPHAGMNRLEKIEYDMDASGSMGDTVGCYRVPHIACYVRERSEPVRGTAIKTAREVFSATVWGFLVVEEKQGAARKEIRMSDKYKRKNLLSFFMRFPPS